MKIADEDNKLICPSCGGSYIHHGQITVFDREEDGKGNTTSIDLLSSDVRNPSERRDGFAVKFWCEGCDDYYELTFSHHKGETWLAWRKPKGSTFG